MEQFLDPMLIIKYCVYHTLVGDVLISITVEIILYRQFRNFEIVHFGLLKVRDNDFKITMTFKSKG